mmetsp:Transcript_45048/g.72372  ORF Transcript_45048/g.72372 Transcript_45048/m.72372 type:complete len:101 (+) Transcript_45048:378-680(+)
MSSERGGQAAFSSGSKTRTKARGFSEALPDTDIERLRTGLFSRNYPHVSQITHPQVDIDGKGIDSINPSHLKKQGVISTWFVLYQCDDNLIRFRKALLQV